MDKEREKLYTQVRVANESHRVAQVAAAKQGLKLWQWVSMAIIYQAQQEEHREKRIGNE